MQDINKLYITTTLPYVNADPHIAHAIEFVLADAISRYYKHKLGKDNVYFNVGTDEHGQKIWDKANLLGINVHEFIDKFASRFIEFCKSFDVEYSFFYRTSKSYHYPVAQSFWNKSLASGDIYKKKYSGKYCIGCENYKLDKELVDGKCPDHGVAPVEKEEENYFFKLSKYKYEILNHILNTDFVIPEADKNFAVEFIKNDLQDISISRLKKDLSWGIPVPNDPDHVMYVWFDALTDYIGSLYYQNDSKKLEDRNFDMDSIREVRNDYTFLQLCGSDNVRFQSIIWQGMLASADIKFTDKLLVHAWILGSDGRKMSKTLGNVVSPFDQLEKYGSEAVRYFFLACMPTTGSSVYDEVGFINQYNSKLADNYGNLLNRVVTLILKYNFKPEIAFTNQDLENQVTKLKFEANSSFDKYNIFEYCSRISEISTLINKYITDEEPWKKDKTDIQRLDILQNCFSALYIITELYEPIIPRTTKQAKQLLDNLETGILVKKIEIKK